MVVAVFERLLREVDLHTELRPMVGSLGCVYLMDGKAVHADKLARNSRSVSVWIFISVWLFAAVGIHVARHYALHDDALVDL